jgi:hypothetical protein
METLERKEYQRTSEANNAAQEIFAVVVAIRECVDVLTCRPVCNTVTQARRLLDTPRKCA